MSKELAIILLLIATTMNIGIHVSSEQERCMIVSSNDEEQFLKIDLKFERFADQTLQ
jgi:hypothetical protein